MMNSIKRTVKERSIIRRKHLLQAWLIPLLLAAAVFLPGCGQEKAADTASSEKALNDTSVEASTGQAASEDAVSLRQVTDDLERTVSFDGPPKRAAALTASFAQTWLLAGGELAAAPGDAWDDLKLDLDDTVMDLGKYNEINTEILYLSQPDLVIGSSRTSNHMELMSSLEKTGIPVLYFEVNSFEDYLSMLKACTCLTGREDLYQRNGLKVKEQVDAAVIAAQKRTEDPKVLLLRTAGTEVKAKDSDSTVAGSILRDLGCINIADGSELLEELSLEKIIMEDPDFIFILLQGNDPERSERAIRENLTDHPAWKDLTAVKEDRVYRLDRNLYQFRPNDRWGEAYEEMEKILYGTP